MSTYWQIAAGSAGRDYSKLFLKFGMAFFGAGSEKLKNINVGDTVILKQGITGISAAGKVVQRDGKHRGNHDEDSPDKDKEWLLDVDGWDLPAWCYVDWRVPGGDEAIAVSGLTRGTISRSYQSGPQKKADEILATGCPPEETEYKGPEETEPVADPKLLETLVREGLSTSSANELTDAVAKIRLLADYYYNHCNWGDIQEHETRTFLVIPLLLALGWSEQQIKIELAKVDIACFSKPYKNEKESKENCVAIIETKGFASGLDHARGQADSYSDDFPNCKALITTNGYCYKIYLKDEKGSFPKDSYDPSAYINLLSPRDKYPLNPKKGNGALDAIKWLLPNNLIQIA